MRIMSSIMKIKNLTIDYNGIIALDNLNLELEKGKFYTILGPNGAGKSTLLKAISKNLDNPRGSVFIDKIDIRDLKIKKLAKKISMVPQETSIDFDLLGEEIVLMGRIPHLKRLEKEGQNDMAIVRDSMKKTNTLHLKNRSVTKMSGGEKQRIIVARALAQEAGIMLLDEPVSQLDLHNQIEIMNIVRELVDKEGLTTICVLHDINLAVNYSDEIIILKEGRLVSKGVPKEIIRQNIIEDTYGIKVKIIDNPVTKKPFIIHVNI